MTNEQLQLLELAFALHFVHRVVDADGHESYSEFKMLGAVFPRPLLDQAGFVDADGAMTERFRDHRDMAMQLLPTQLDRAQKLQLLDLLFEASAIDGVEAAEMRVLAQAGAALGLDEALVTTHLASRASA